MVAVQPSYFDAIVITANIEGFEVRRKLMDDGNSRNILFLEAFIGLGIDSKNLKPCSGGLVGFTSHKTLINKMITLPLSIGKWPKISIEMVDFMVVETPFAYNGIIGRSSQVAMEIISSVNYQLTKFPIPEGTGQGVAIDVEKHILDYPKEEGGEHHHLPHDRRVASRGEKRLRGWSEREHEPVLVIFK